MFRVSHKPRKKNNKKQKSPVPCVIEASLATSTFSNSPSSPAKHKFIHETTMTTIKAGHVIPCTRQITPPPALTITTSSKRSLFDWCRLPPLLVLSWCCAMERILLYVWERTRIDQTTRRGYGDRGGGWRCLVARRLFRC